MLPKQNRITHPNDYTRLHKQGKKVYTPGVIISCTPGATDHTRVGFIVTKKVGNSVVRHQTVRWLRETVRPHLNTPTPMDIVIIARKDDRTILPVVEKFFKKLTL